MGDLIERQKAVRKLKRMATQAYIDKLNGSAETIINCCIDVIERQTPSAQPEIIQCKDCKWYELPSHKITENCVRWMKSNGILLPIKPNDFCSYAERRTDGVDS